MYICIYISYTFTIGTAIDMPFKGPSWSNFLTLLPSTSTAWSPTEAHDQWPEDGQHQNWDQDFADQRGVNAPNGSGGLVQL